MGPQCPNMASLAVPLSGALKRKREVIEIEKEQ